MISGIYTAILLIVFLAIVVWAWSKKNKDKFDEISQMPLMKDNENHQSGDKQ
jgi:cytochrome c oxidase cbb3-type subunit 4